MGGRFDGWTFDGGEYSADRQVASSRARWRVRSYLVHREPPPFRPGHMESSDRTLERIAALDVVRGFAVAGILFANVLTFFGIFALPDERASALSTAEADRIAVFLEHAFISGKFYSIFSLLFGIGFGLQLARGGDAALPRFNRRLRILLAIGAIHAVFVWAGDILMLYALLGFTLPWFARKSDRDLVRWALLLLVSPTALYLLALAIRLIVAGSAPPTPGDTGVPPQIVAILERVGTGGVLDAFIGNALLLVGRWMDLFATVRFPKVLGMFVLGLWLARRGIALSPSSHRDLISRWMRFGLAIGLPTNLVAAWAIDRWPYLPPSIGGLVSVVTQAIGIPMLALGYAATIALLIIDGRRMVTVFAPVGRMALTNYLMHSVVCVTLSYGFGFGLWWRIGASTAMAIAAAIVLAQIPLSAWWLTRARFGPIEWIWRRLTYRQPIALLPQTR